MAKKLKAVRNLLAEASAVTALAPKVGVGITHITGSGVVDLQKVNEFAAALNERYPETKTNVAAIAKNVIGSGPRKGQKNLLLSIEKIGGVGSVNLFASGKVSWCEMDLAGLVGFTPA
jgi:hypothetical protein